MENFFNAIALPRIRFLYLELLFSSIFPLKYNILSKDYKTVTYTQVTKLGGVLSVFYELPGYAIAFRIED